MEPSLSFNIFCNQQKNSLWDNSLLDDLSGLHRNPAQNEEKPTHIAEPIAWSMGHKYLLLRHGIPDRYDGAGGSLKLCVSRTVRGPL